MMGILLQVWWNRLFFIALGKCQNENEHVQAELRESGEGNSMTITKSPLLAPSYYSNVLALIEKEENEGVPMNLGILTSLQVSQTSVLLSFLRMQLLPAPGECNDLPLQGEAYFQNIHPNSPPWPPEPHQTQSQSREEWVLSLIWEESACIQHRKKLQNVVSLYLQQLMYMYICPW